MNLDHNVANFDIEEISRETLKTKKREKIFYTEIFLKDIPNEMFKGSKKKEINIILSNIIQYLNFQRVQETFLFL